MNRIRISEPNSAGLEGESPWYPPRAPSARARLRGPLRDFQRGLRSALQKARPFFPSWLTGDPVIATLLSAAPGLGHFYTEGRPGAAAAFFSTFVVLWAWAILFPPQTGGGLLSVTLFSFHNWVMADAFSRQRAACGFAPLKGLAGMRLYLFCAGFLALLYYGARETVQAHGAAVQITTDLLEPAFSAGDRLLVFRQDSYRRGDIVFSSAAGSLERVLAVGGDDIRIGSEGIFLNGRPLPKASHPLSRGLMESPNLHGVSARVPEGNYCILFPANTYVYHGMTIYKNELFSHFMIPGHDIAGKAAFQYSPFIRRIQ